MLEHPVVHVESSPRSCCLLSAWNAIDMGATVSDTKVLVIDYRTGNSQSVAYALASLGIPHQVARHPAEVTNVTHVILPGVGAAGTTMHYLREDGWLDFLQQEVVVTGTPFLGVCVGLQVIFEASDEQDATCLGWLPGRVRAFDRSAVRVPHMGWNRVSSASGHPFVAHLPADPYFYFVNSYYAVPADASLVVGTANYDGDFAAIVARGNIMATQFHIEKSGPVGLGLLGRFASLSREEVS
jgi:glutamine amidotransferase